MAGVKAGRDRLCWVAGTKLHPTAVRWGSINSYTEPLTFISACMGQHGRISPKSLSIRLISRPRCRRSASSLSLNVYHTLLSTTGDRAFPVAAARTWNSLPQHETSDTSAPSVTVFRGRLKVFLFGRSFP